ncbi:STAS domain-containing protein [Limnoglobus roseus]|uniref:STAS domain-containing protein n=1 Tax=Limnoglobus roseus TaxID=2598579 RepID=A0A5C1AME1_9BACT|nr:hypothetical protein [Limnoglobus roseus]QEL18364.1 hypothetical protein PX52LOC_05387 [Limnoglobus roseus]
MDNAQAANLVHKPAAAPQSGVYSAALGEAGNTADGGMKLTYNPVAGDPIVRVQCEGVLTVRGRIGGEPLKDLLGPRCYGLQVVMNLERVVGVETSGISWVMQTGEKFNTTGGRLILFSVPVQVTSLFQLLEMDLPFAVAANQTAAVAMAQTPPR